MREAYDVIVVGAGPAGLGAAIVSSWAVAEDIAFGSIGGVLAGFDGMLFSGQAIGIVAHGM